MTSTVHRQNVRPGARFRDRRHAFRENLGLLLWCTGIALIFCGFYAAMTMFQMATASIEGTRALTIPLRLVLLTLLGAGFFLLLRKFDTFRVTFADGMLLIFAAAYLLRIYVSLGSGYLLHREPVEILLYFLGFCVFPFMFIRFLDITPRISALTFKFVTVGAAAFAVLTTIAFQDIIDIGARAAISFGADDIISPLFLSYCGAIGIGLSLAGLFSPTISKRWRLVLFATAAVSLVPFFVGGSRGAIISIVIPFLLFTPFSRSKKFLVRVAILFILFGMLTIASLYLDTTAFRRFGEIFDDIDNNAAEASRIFLWATSISQFAEAPLFGSSLQNTAFAYYPHNFLLEALISTGILGGIPLALVVAACLWKCRLVTIEQPENYWIVVLFVQALLHTSLSGALYSASWLAASMALLMSVAGRNGQAKISQTRGTRLSRNHQRISLTKPVAGSAG